jgi:uridine phosphorylase
MEGSKKTRKGNESSPGVMNLNNSTTPFTASDFPIDSDGRVYHLQVKPEQIAHDILLVGDPGRAEFFGDRFLRDVDLAHEHRGLVTLTGTADVSSEQVTIISPMRTTIATSGMGTPSLEIIVSELVALNEINFETRTRKPNYPRLHIIRVGSSGGLQASTELGTPIITTYAIGLDNTGLFYESPYQDHICERLERELGEVVNKFIDKKSRFNGKIYPYVSRSEPALVNAMVAASEHLGVKTKKGLTVSCPGFFAPEGRDIARIKPSLPEIDKILSEFDPRLEGQRIENMEMESSFLSHYLGGLGYWAGTICPAIANRRQDTFTDQYEDAMVNAARVALLALATLRKHSEDVRIS